VSAAAEYERNQAVSGTLKPRKERWPLVNCFMLKSYGFGCSQPFFRSLRACDFIGSDDKLQLDSVKGNDMNSDGSQDSLSL
jgi:hypothetical protein